MFNFKKKKSTLVGSLLVISLACFSTVHESQANSTVDERRLSTANQQQGDPQTQWAEENRSSIIHNILNRLQAEAQTKGYKDWREELSAFLNKASAQKLLNAYHADSFGGVVAAIRGAKSIQPQAYSVESAGLSSNELLGDDMEDLVYTPLTPCRIVDTRNVGGKFNANEMRSYSVNGNTLGQSGAPNPSNCGVPNGVNEPPAVVLNVTSTRGESNGFLTVWEFGNLTNPMDPNYKPRPNASLLNYQTDDVANAAIVPTGLGTASEIRVFASARTDVIIDVVGYLRKSEATPIKRIITPNHSERVPSDGNLHIVRSENCPTGYTAVGGEFQWNSSIGATLVQSLSSSSDNNWICSGRTTMGSRLLSCRAVCIQIPGH